MGTQTANADRGLLTVPGLSPFRRIAELRAAWAQYRAYAETLAELHAMSDRDLADIGISRVSIRDVAREAVYGK